MFDERGTEEDKRQKERRKIAPLNSVPEVANLCAMFLMLRSFVKTVRDDFDHDEDAHKYNTFCRCCEATKVLRECDDT